MSKRVVLIDKGKQMWHLYCSENNLILKSENSKEVICENVKKGYDALITDDKIIDIVCMDKDNNAYYIRKDKVLEQKCIFESSEEINTKFSVVRVNEVTLVFYILPKAGKKALVYQILSPAEKGPVIVDYVSGDDFYITKSEDNIKAFYKNENGLLGYLKFIWNKKEWENFVPLYETDKKINGICAFEKDEKIYIVFLEKTLEKYRLIFIEYTLGKIKTKKLFLNCFFDSDPSVYSYNNKIYISFRLGIRALFCYLDSSFILSSPNYMFPAFYKKQECVRLSTNIDLGTSGVFGDYFYAMIDDEENIELGVINHILKKIEPQKTQDIKEVGADILEFSNTKEKDEQDIEIGRINAKMSMLEKELKEINKENAQNLISKIERLEEEIEKLKKE